MNGFCDNYTIPFSLLFGWAMVFCPFLFYQTYWLGHVIATFSILPTLLVGHVIATFSILPTLLVGPCDCDLFYSPNPIGWAMVFRPFISPPSPLGWAMVFRPFGAKTAYAYLLTTYHLLLTTYNFPHTCATRNGCTSIFFQTPFWI
jgi:hypothetical protein